MHARIVTCMLITLSISGCGGGDSPDQGNSPGAPSVLGNTQSGGGGAEANVGFTRDRYVALGRLVLRDSYLSPNSTIPQAARDKGVNTLFGLDPDFVPTDYVKNDACWDGSGSWCYHTGIDYRTSSGLAVYSPVDGEVASDPGGTYGKVTIKDDTSGKYLTFLHLSDTTLVKKGDRVSVGCIVGKTGAAGTQAPHLHVEVRDSSGIMGWIGTTEGLQSAGAISPLTLLDSYGLDASKLAQGSGLPATVATCSSQGAGGGESNTGGSTTPPPTSGGGANTGGGSATPPPTSNEGGSNTGGGATVPAPIPTCIGTSGQIYTSGQVETIVNTCQDGYQGSITLRRTCQPSSAEGWFTEKADTCTPIQPSISKIEFYNFNAGNGKIYSSSFFRYNNALIHVIGSHLPATAVVEVAGLTCNISASNSISAYSSQVGGVSVSATTSQGIYSPQYVYPSVIGIGNGFVSVCDGASVQGNTTYTVRVKSKAGTSFEYIGNAQSVYAYQ